jgi:hypothetical protein
MTSIAQADAALRVAATGQRFYVGMAASCFAVALLGFAPTYWVPMLRGTLDVPPITHLHAVFFYGWTLLFVGQAWLVASRRITRHRELGLLGVSLATGMCFVGLAAAVATLKRFEPTPMADAARAFSVVPITGIVFFAAVFALAIVNVKRPEVHKRLLLVATVSLLNAAVGRWFALFLAPPVPEGLQGAVAPPPVAISLLPGFTADLLLVVAMMHDRRTRGAVHRVYWVAGGALVASQLLRVPLSMTDAWSAVARALVALAP